MKGIHSQKDTTLTEDEKENLNRPVTVKEIELATKKLPIKKSPQTTYIIGELCQMFKNKVTSHFHKLFQKIKEKSTLSKSFYRNSITVIPKLDKKTTD